ncbi:MAG: hypothetical protein ACM3NH_04540 [Candidatus Saccharibacteria bacterium]
MEIPRKYLKKGNEQHIHSPAHALADELVNKFADRKRFGFYLKMATLYDHNMLRRIAGQVLEAKAKKPGALFAYLIKKENEEKKAKQ